MQYPTTRDTRPPFVAVRSCREMSLDGLSALYLAIFHDALRNDPRIFENQFLSSNNGLIPPPNLSTSLNTTPLYENGSPPEHYQGSTNAPSTLNDTDQGTPVVDNQVNNSARGPPILCLQPRPDGTACGEQITCCDVPEHFKEMHEIEGLGRNHRVACQWAGCNRCLSRHNFVRHVREQHFEVDRNSTHKCGTRSTQTGGMSREGGAYLA